MRKTKAASSIMRKFYTLFALLSIGSLAHADTYTNRIGLDLPTCGSQNWCNSVNGNFQIIDSTINTSGGGGGGSGSNALAVFVNGVQVSSPTQPLGFTGSGVTYSNSGSSTTVIISGGSTVLTSSGIAFGSPTNTVTSDTNTFSWDNTLKNLGLIGSAYFSHTGGAPFSTPFTFSCTNQSETYCVSIGNDYPTGSALLVSAGTYGIGINAAAVSGSTSTAAEFQTVTSTAIWIQSGIGTGMLFTGGGNALEIDGGSIKLNTLTASQFVKTDASDNLVSYDLLNATQTWTGQQTFKNQINVSTSIIDGLGNVGSSGQVLSSQGTGQPVKWITSSGSSGASALAVTTGTTAGFGWAGSSPTAAEVYNGARFTVGLQGLATAYVDLLSTQTFSQLVVTGNVTASSFTSTGGGAGAYTAVEGAAPSGVSGSDILYGDSSAHWFRMINNNGTNYQVMGSSTVPIIGHVAVFSSSETVIDGGAAGVGTITGVVAGPGLSGGGTSGSVTVSVSSVSLSTQVVGNLPVTNLNSGTNADSSHFWRGDGTWVSSGTFGGGGGTPGGSSGQVQYNNASSFGGISGSYVGTSSVTAGITQYNNLGVIASTITVYSTAVSTMAFVVQSTNSVNIFTVPTSSVTPGDYMVYVASANPGALLHAINTYGMMISSGTTPTAGTCGTLPAMNAGSTDMVGSVTWSGAASSCVINFSRTYSAAPFCFAETSGAGFVESNTSTSAMTWTLSASVTGGTLTYFCVCGSQGCS